ncbi:uncharacterized protein [Haliotis asinina]|uniref:uncharacterized protein n=1 Tax=Haliotis asinina TaxID=109174 RepID=UPI0035325FBF
MDNISTMSFNASDILPPQETTIGCNATNMSSGCDDAQHANQTDHLFDRILQITEITFTCFDILNLLGNAVLMVLIYKASTKMEASGRLLLNQAVADAGIGLSWLTLYGVLYSNPHRDILRTAIIVQRVITGILYCESGLSLAMTLFALHIAICNPIFYKVYQEGKTTRAFIVLSWLLATGSWTMTFAANDFFIQERDSIIILLNLRGQNIWFACILLLVVVIVPLAMIITALTRICLYLHKEENSSIALASATKRYVRQAKGILIVCITYIVTFVPLFAFPYFGTYFESNILLFITGTSLAFLNYVYIVFKLPLFLLAFKSYRRVASRIFCRRLAPRFVSSGDGSTLSEKKYKTSTNTRDRLDASGSQPAEQDARSIPIQVDETTGNIGRVNYGFTSSFSVNCDGMATSNATDDDVTSSIKRRRHFECRQQ